MTNLQLAEFCLKATASVIGLAGAFVAVMKWLDQRHKDSLTAKVEAQKPFSSKQQEVYLELVEITATISNTLGHTNWNAAVSRFWVMFWGVVPLVADEDVAFAVDQFSIALDDTNDGVALRNASMNLARACRRSLGVSWNADLKSYLKVGRQTAS